MFISLTWVTVRIKTGFQIVTFTRDIRQPVLFCDFLWWGPGHGGGKSWCSSLVFGSRLLLLWMAISGVSFFFQSLVWIRVFTCWKRSRWKCLLVCVAISLFYSGCGHSWGREAHVEDEEGWEKQTASFLLWRTGLGQMCTGKTETKVLRNQLAYIHQTGISEFPLVLQETLKAEGTI